MTANVIWIASYPKSGNTWLRAFLLYLFMNARERRPLGELADMSTFDSASGFFNLAAGENREIWTEEQTAQWRAAAQREMLKRFDQTSFVKTHSALRMWHGHPMFDLATTAGAVYLVRNPLDIVASLAANIGRPIADVVKIVNTPDFVWPGTRPQVPQLVGSWSENVISWTGRPNPALHVMRYEDMVADAPAAFTGLTGFLKLNPPAERFQRAIELTSFESLQQTEEQWGFGERTVVQEKFFRNGRVGGWRDELTPEQAKSIVDAHREQMARFGYVPEGM